MPCFHAAMAVFYFSLMSLNLLEALPVPSSLPAAPAAFCPCLPLHFQAVCMRSLLCVTCRLTEGNVILRSPGLLETFNCLQSFPISTCLSFVFPALSVDHLLASGLQGWEMKYLGRLKVSSRKKQFSRRKCSLDQ